MIYDNIVRKNSLIDKYRLQSIHSLSKMVNNLEGDVVEVGVYKGGSGRFLCQHFPNNLIYLIDTFEGLPQESVHDNFHKKGDFNDSSVDHVKSVLMPYTNYRLIKSAWPNSKIKDLDNINIKFLHLDVDLYECYYENLKYFWPKIVSGGILVFDDYGHYNCLGSKKAVDQFVEENDLILYSGPKTQAHIIK